MTFQWLSNWSNLLFIVPFVLALLYLGLYTITGITFGDADADVGGDFDADVDGDLHLDGDIHADMDADGDADAPDHDMEADADGDADAHVEPNAAMAALQWLGVGRVPVSIILMVLLLTWGWIGFVCNVILLPRFGAGSGMAAISLPVALVGSLIITRFVVSLVARWLPTCETNARRRHELLGSVGEAVFNIDDKFGMTSIRAETGDLYQVPCRVEPGQAMVAKGEAVKLVAYNVREGIFKVIPWSNNVQPVALGGQQRHSADPP